MWLLIKEGEDLFNNESNAKHEHAHIRTFDGMEFHDVRDVVSFSTDYFLSWVFIIILVI